jgi:hypothetical protein
MKRISLVAAALCVAVAAPVSAQAPTPGGLRYGIHAGALLPMGNYADFDKLGWVAGAGGTYWLTGGSLGIQVDGSYSQTSHDGVPGKSNIVGGLASLVYGLSPATASARPFISGGLGYYNVKVDDGAGTSVSESKVGFGIGAGVSLKMGTSSNRIIIATRYTSVSTSGSSTTFLPLTVGLSFGK